MLAAWHEVEARKPVAWLTLDEGDNDPAALGFQRVFHLGGNGQQVVTGHLPECEPALMDSDRPRGRRYRLVLRGEMGEPFAFLFEGMRMERLAGTTVLTGPVIDQAHLVGLIQRTQELGLELVSIGSADEGARNPRPPRPGGYERDLRDGSRERS